jgi:dephospho-CoA kinase
MGKSTVADFFTRRGVCVVDTDRIARDIVMPGSPALNEIASRLGGEFVLPDGKLDRARMAARVFSDVTARKELEAILHPPIRKRWQARLAEWQDAGESLAVVVIPLLYETAAETELNRVLCVACSGPTQRQRLAPRGWSVEEMDRRNAAQLPVAEKIHRADHLIWSEGELAATRAQADRLLERLA